MPGSNIESIQIDSSYSISYPVNSNNAAVYTAVELQYHFYNQGLKLSLNNAAKANQIQIVENPNMVTGTYSVRRDGKNLIVTAGDQFGFTGAAEYLTGTFFKKGLTTEPLWGNFRHTGVYTREMLNQKTGENRVMFQNIWAHAWAEAGGEAGVTEEGTPTSLPYVLAMVEAYRPGVIAFNEYWLSWVASDLEARMAALGYGCIYKPVERAAYSPNVTSDRQASSDRVSHTTNANAPDSIIFYDRSQVTLVSGSDMWLSFGAVTTASTTLPNGYVKKTPVLRSNGYYHDNSLSGMGATIATFENAKGERFTVCCTHFDSNGTVAQRTVPWGNPIRWEQVEKLVTCLNTYQADFKAPILVGGDYNSADSYNEGTYTTQMIGADAAYNYSQAFTWNDMAPYGGNKQLPILTSACDLLVKGGFFNNKTATTDTTYNGSAHGYPIYNTDLGAYVEYVGSIANSSSSDGYKTSIDHVYSKNYSGSSIATTAYRNVCDPTTMMYADHKALLVDFDLNTSKDVAKFEDNDVAGDTWQGMNDYAAPTKGLGTQAEPYLIERPEHLAWLSRATNDITIANAFLGKNNGLSRIAFSGVYFKQTADLDLAGKAFTPIGYYQSGSNYVNRNAFGGVYDGGEFTIKNATINAQKDKGLASITTVVGLNEKNEEILKGDTYVSGIFGVIGSGATIKNIIAKNVDVGTILSTTASTSAATFGETISGVIVGMANGATITNCTTDVACSAAGVYAGGIVGFTNAATEISYCTNRAVVTGDIAAGGIIGSADANTITYNVNYGKINMITFTRWAGIGGIIGAYNLLNDTSANAVSYCVNAGKLTVIADRNASGSNHRVGMGGIIGNDNTAKLASYTYCFNLTEEFSATAEHTAIADNFLPCSGGIAGYAMDGTPTTARVYSNCYSVAGVTHVNAFGAPSEKDWTSGNANAYAGIITGDLNTTQVGNSLKGGSIAEAFKTCHYGVDASEITANEIYLWIIRVAV
ncbi:MAG: hypothetical protein IKJ35_07780 [Clostridia bacterium]|nr:hypothetical protein [Clostridia bacterium]